MVVPYKYSKLRGKIAENFETERAFAKALGISNSTLSAKLCGKNRFTQDEIYKAIEILRLEKVEVHDCFFLRNESQKCDREDAK